jgi:peptidyl-Lys metalloendopeptidase
MDTLHINLYSHDQYKKDEATSLIFEVANPTKKPIRILKWNTPLEGLRSDCLDVKRNGKPVPYDGIMVKRGAPTADDFVTIPPGKSVTNKVDLGGAYDMSSAGQVKVDYKKEGLRVAADTSAVNPAEAMRTGVAAPVLFKSARQLKVVTKKADFRISGGTKPRLPLGAQARLSQPANRKAANRQPANRKTTAAKKVNAAVTGPYPCLLTGGTAAKQGIVKKAHENGYKLVVAALQTMADNKQYKTWFGAYAKPRFTKAKTDFQKMKAEYETRQFTYDLSGTSADCQGNTYAYTYKGGNKIWLCSAFWAAPDTGADSRAGTIVHERSHASAFTDDLAYGEDDCMALARSSPAKAIDNADSHEFFAKG